MTPRTCLSPAPTTSPSSPHATKWMCCLRFNDLRRFSWSLLTATPTRFCASRKMICARTVAWWSLIWWLISCCGATLSHDDVTCECVPIQWYGFLFFFFFTSLNFFILSTLCILPFVFLVCLFLFVLNLWLLFDQIFLKCSFLPFQPPLTGVTFSWEEHSCCSHIKLSFIPVFFSLF